MTRSILKMLTAGAAGAVLTAAWMTWSARTATSPNATPALTSASAGPTIERLRALSALTTLRVEVADALVTELRGRTGGLKAVLTVRGEVRIGVDLSAARFESLDHHARTAKLVLPHPRLQSAALDHERTRLVGVFAAGLWKMTPGGGDADAAAVNCAYRDAQRALGLAAADPTLIDRTRTLTENVLKAFLQSLGWSLTIAWTEHRPVGLGPAGREIPATFL